MSAQSARRRGQGAGRSRTTGSSTASATVMRYTANAAGGTSRTPSLMNSQTVLQIAQVNTQTNSVNGVMRLPKWRCTPHGHDHRAAWTRDR